MNTIEISKQREQDAILFLLNKIKPIFEMPNVTDIWVDDGVVSYKEFGKKRTETDIFLNEQECINIIKNIANHMDVTIDMNKYPVLEGTIPCWDARITGVRKWVKYPYITIRKRPSKIYTLNDYIEKGQLSIEKANLIREYIANKKNILVSGGTGSGKSTFTTAILCEMANYTPDDSFLILEDNPELQSTAKYAKFMLTGAEEAILSVKLALRLTPDRIIFGEIRDGKVLWALLDLWNTGHPGGVSTIHASSAEGTFLRMRTLLKQTFGIEQPVTNLIDMIVHMSKSQDENKGVEVDEVIITKDYTDEQIEAIAQMSIEAEA